MILSFLLEYKTNWQYWQMDLIEIVRDESWYFMPQIQTKILNEGWASFWHYKILHELNLKDELLDANVINGFEFCCSSSIL